MLLACSKFLAWRSCSHVSTVVMIRFVRSLSYPSMGGSSPPSDKGRSVLPFEDVVELLAHEACFMLAVDERVV